MSRPTLPHPPVPARLSLTLALALILSLSAAAIGTARAQSDAVPPPLPVRPGPAADAGVGADALQVDPSWLTTGNAGTTSGTHFLGTTDNQALDIRAKNFRILRLEPPPSSFVTVGNIVGGHSSNSVACCARGATVAGGGDIGAANSVSANFGTIGGGLGNTVSGLTGSIMGGLNNTVSGQRGSVLGGEGNLAAGNHSLAGGRRARANHTGALVLADSNNFEFTSTAANELSVRAVGGARIVSAINGSGTPTAGVVLAAGGGAWSSLSDRNAKHAFADVDRRQLLHTLADVPIQTWQYNSQPDGIRHIGPTAQDFHRAFGVGEDPTRISTVDADGVALAAVQGLYDLAVAQEADLRRLTRENRVLEARLADLEAQVDRLARQARAGATADQP